VGSGEAGELHSVFILASALTQSQVQGKKLTEVINRSHRNERYLPDIHLPKNLVAVPHLKDVVKDATLLVFVTPHQFLHTVLRELQRSNAILPGARAVSAIKGVEVNGTDISTFAGLIENKLGTPASALSGANIALEGTLTGADNEQSIANP
jgi:glycerol-3-phosphate dehydrogenase (NAD+)